MFKIGKWTIDSPTILAPMAGVTDAPFRQLCRTLGVGLTVSEMVTSDEKLWSSRKSKQRLSNLYSEGAGVDVDGANLHRSKNNNELRSVQLAGNDPQMMAAAAQANVAMGAQIIDINMGCPAKKVCKKAAGSALLKDEKLVQEILTAVVTAVDVPVTLKIRTGWSQDQRNGCTIARIAQDAGIQALAVHGRTRACAFKGQAEYDTIASIVQAVDIPVFANGDITSPEKALYVLNYTNAAAVMIGRAAQGNPWIFREINHYLSTGQQLAKPSTEEVHRTLHGHLEELHRFYGELMGVRIARKHVGWYLKQQAQSHTANTQEYTKETTKENIDIQYENFRKAFNRIESPQEQYKAVENFFLTQCNDRTERTQLLIKDHKTPDLPTTATLGSTKELKEEIAA